MKSAPILGDAQAAAEAEVARQGFPAEVLARNNVHFGEGAAGLALADAIAWAWWPWRCSTWPGTGRPDRVMDLPTPPARPPAAWSSRARCLPFGS
jgi:hypothetical protein